jgi:MFS family permease
MKNSSQYRWFVIAVFFLFMLLHQADKLLIGPMTSTIMDEFGISMTQMGAVSTGALIVGAIFYPLWGYLYDRYARSKLLALASFLWGVTTMFNARARSYLGFLVTRSSTGIDDSSYPGLYSLVSDYFGPQVRGKVYGILQLTAPLGYMLGMVLGIFLSGSLGWRGVFYLTGSLGIFLSLVIFFGVKEQPRGKGEPELAEFENFGQIKFNWKTAIDLLKKPSLILLFAQGFFGVFPWNAITYWFFTYLERERNYPSEAVFTTMIVAVLVLAAGYPIGGALGDYFFKRNPRGRLIVSTIGVILGAIFLAITLNIPLENQLLFMIMLSLTALLIPIAASNVLATIFDITQPEVRSTAQSLSSFIESAGAALSPLLVGYIADQSSLKNAFLLICLTTWGMCALFFIVTSYLAPRDMKTLRRQMQLRAQGLPAEPEKGPPGFVGFYVLYLILVGGFGLMFSVAYPALSLGASLSTTWISLSFFLAPLLSFVLAWGIWKLKNWARFLIILSHSIGFLAGIGISGSLIDLEIKPVVGLLLLIFNGLVAYWFIVNGKYFRPTATPVLSSPDIQ